MDFYLDPDGNWEHVGVIQVSEYTPYADIKKPPTFGEGLTFLEETCPAQGLARFLKPQRPPGFQFILPHALV